MTDIIEIVDPETTPVVVVQNVNPVELNVGAGPQGPIGPVGPTGPSDVVLLGPNQLRGADAGSGLIIREGSYKNLVTNPRGITPDTTVRERRRNLIPNPTCQTNTTRWSHNAGASGAATVTRVATGGPTNGPFGRMTITAASATLFGLRYDGRDGSLPVTPGATYSGALYVRSSVSQQVQPVIWFFDGANAQSGAATQPLATIPANTWVRLSVSGAADPTAVNGMFGVQAAGGSVVGQTLDMAFLILEKDVAVSDYFDGDTPDNSVQTFEWVGTPHASASRLLSAYVETRRNVYRGGVSADNFSHYVSVSGDGSDNTIGAINRIVDGVTYPTVRAVAGSSTTRIGLYSEYFDPQPGLFTVSADVYLPVESWGSNPVDFEWIYRDGPNNDSLAADKLASSGQIIPGEWSRVYGVASTRANRNVTTIYLRPIQTPNPGDWWETSRWSVEPNVSLPGDYFLGSTTDTDPYVYEWTGTANDSPSVQLSRQPLGWETAAVPMTQEIAADQERATAIRFPGAVGPNAGYSVTGLVAGRTYTILAAVYAPTGSPNWRLLSTVPDLASTTVTAKNVWVVERHTFVATAATTSARLQSMTAQAGPIYVRFVVTEGTYDGPFFDGSAGPASWDNPSEPHNSTSTLANNVASYWDGTTERWFNADIAADFAKLFDDVATNKDDLGAATDSATANTLVRRNSAGNIVVNQMTISAPAPTYSAAATRKDYVDAIGTADANADTVVRRSANADIYARYVVGTGTSPAASHLVRRDYVDAIGTASVTADTIVRRDSNSRAAFDAVLLSNPTPVAANHATSKAYVDAIGTDQATGSTVVRRNAAGDSSFRAVHIVESPFSSSAVRKDYVDSQDSAFRRLQTSGLITSNYTLVLSDEGRIIRMNGSSDLTVTIPPDSEVAFSSGSWLEVIRISSSNRVTIAPGAGVTIDAPDSALELRARFSSVRLLKTAPNVWSVRGDTNDAVAQAVAGATSTATPNSVVRRDANGNFEADLIGLNELPTAAYHATRKDYVDGIGTPANTENTIVRRGSAGAVDLGVTTVAPSSLGAAATRKDYVDTQIATRAASTHTHTATQISDSTTVGRSVIMAADAAAARTAIGAGTSSLVIGTTSTTAKAGNYSPPAATETASGIVELATAAETITGTDGVRAVTPSGLKTTLSRHGTLLGLNPNKLTGLARAEYVQVAANSSYDIFNRATGTSGTIKTIWMAIDGLTNFAGNLDSRFQVFYGGSAIASIDIDLGTLFSTHGGVANLGQWSSRHIHAEQSRGPTNGDAYTGMTFSFPMPYQNGIRIAIKTPSTAGIGLYSQVVHDPDTTSSVRLVGNGTWYSGANLLITMAQTPTLFTRTGAGWLVYNALFGFQAGNKTWLERNVRLTVDGGTPMDSTGWEDWFYGSFYWHSRGQYGTPYSHVGINNTNETAVGVDLLELFGGIKYDTSISMQILTEARVQADVRIAWIALFYEAV